MLPDIYLSVQPNQKGPFVSWLEELGLKDLINRYSLPKLLEWNWLVPQHQVAFPAEYFEEATPENIFNTENYSTDNDPRYRLLGYGDSWQIESTEDTHWFLHPFYRPDSDYKNLLNQTDSLAMPNVYYFFHWQAYALIDVVRTASTGTFPILNTPDIEQDIVRVANCEIKPSDVLNQPHRWEGLSKPMTWLSHYRAFREALPCKTDRQCSLHKQGAEALAEYLEINAEILEKAIKEQLLQRLAGSWLKTNYDCEEWTLQAWPYLQKDIFFAMEWLCILNGKNFSDYFKRWQFSDEREVWPPLHKVLPFEYFEDRQYFLSTLPRYKRFYKGILPTDEKLDQLVTHLQQTNPPFDSLLNAFRQFHEHLMYRPQQKGSLDFRVLRPLDYYSLLAIRAETCLRYALEERGLLKTITNQGLEGYIGKFSELKHSTAIVKHCFHKEVKNLTKLHETPENPISKIMKVQCDSVQDTHLLQAFLCCVLARNYFAHHTYLNQKFMQNQKEESAFMLIGILVTVLKLLSD
jgi:hypothetical protein